MEIEETIARAARRIGVHSNDLLAVIEAVSITRRGSTEWSEHDLQIAESAIGTFILAVRAYNANARRGTPPAGSDQNRGE